ncbi:MAG: hypothetical protein H0W61_01930 [Bacteroidetes bacterium]|nr:hypothetical protein [Bacteroidota bacterium]
MLACNKEKNSYNVYFYTNKKDEYTHLKLYINEKEKGDLPYFTTKLNFENDTLMPRALYLKMAPGNYPIIIKDQWGNVKLDGHIKVKRKSLVASSVIGELITTTKDHDAIVELNYN